MGRSWIALHPDWYVAERHLMARRFPEFRLSATELSDGRLAYVGELITDTGDDKIRDVTLLQFPEATPYQAPIVYPLTALPEGDDWRCDDLVRRTLRRMPRGYRRHQMANGSLCLAESDAYRTEESLQGTELLWRAKEVFKALTLGLPFPFPDSEEAELEAHFITVGDILLPEAFFDPGVSGRGRMYAFPYPDDRPGAPGYVCQTQDRQLLIGVNLSQTTNAGLTTDWRNAVDEPIQHILPWLAKAAFTFEGVITDPVLRDWAIEGRWYDLLNEPEPARDGRELETSLLAAGLVDPIADLSQQLLEPRKNFLGLRFPARRGTGREWLMLRLVSTELDDIDVRQALKRDPDLIRDIARSAHVVALRSHALLRHNLEFRNGSTVSALHEKSVLVIGGGALGGDVAVTLGRAGVKALTLIDYDRMRVGNAIRHVAPILATGLLKVDAVRHQIWAFNPYVDVKVIDANATVDLERLEALLHDCDVAVSTIADENAEMAINEAAIRVNRTVIYGRALRAGTVARVFRVRPGHDACKRCLSLYAHQPRPIDDTVGWLSVPEADGEVLGRECGSPVLAGSAVDLRIAADFTARAVLQELGEGQQWNMLLWSREALPALATEFAHGYAAKRDTFPPRADCPACRRPITTEILVSRQAHSDIVRWTEAKADVETGGVLIGYRDADGRVYVLEATDAGPNAVETAALFERDAEYCQVKLDDAAARLGHLGRYVGEWHSHLEPNPKPSARDIESLIGIAEAPNYLTDEPVMLIAGRDPASGQVRSLHGSCFPIGFRMVEREWSVLDPGDRRSADDAATASVPEPDPPVQ